MQGDIQRDTVVLAEQIEALRARAVALKWSIAQPEVPQHIIGLPATSATRTLKTAPTQAPAGRQLVREDKLSACTDT